MFFPTYLSLILCTFLPTASNNHSTFFFYIHFIFSQPIPTTNRFVPGFNHFVVSLTTMCFSNSNTPFINHLFSFKLTILIVLSPTDFLPSFTLPAIFWIRLFVFYFISLQSLQGELCRGSYHPNSR